MCEKFLDIPEKFPFDDADFVILPCLTRREFFEGVRSEYFSKIQHARALRNYVDLADT